MSPNFATDFRMATASNVWSTAARNIGSSTAVKSTTKRVPSLAGTGRPPDRQARRAASRRLARAAGLTGVKMARHSTEDPQGHRASRADVFAFVPATVDPWPVSGDARPTISSGIDRHRAHGRVRVPDKAIAHVHTAAVRRSPRRFPESRSTKPMTTQIDSLLARLRSLQEELEAEFEALRREVEFAIGNRRIRFPAHILNRQRLHKVGVWRYLRHSRILVALTAPSSTAA
jgi:hypothetical protein